MLGKEKDNALSHTIELSWDRNILVDKAIQHIRRWMVSSSWDDNESILNNDYIAIESLIIIKDYDKAISKYNNTIWNRGLESMYSICIKSEYIEGDPTLSIATSPSTKIGHACVKCTTYYEYASSNQSNGSYLCRSCSIFTNIFSP